MRRLLLVSLLSLGCATAAPVEKLFKPSNRAEERAELIAKLRRDLIKVDRSIGVTERLIAQSRSAPYLPDLIFREAELYVEKSRYRFNLERELHDESGKSGSLVVPDVSLLKQKAVSLYERIVREFPDYKENDKVRFFTAHEYRELGQYECNCKGNGPGDKAGTCKAGEYEDDKDGSRITDKCALRLYHELVQKNPKSALVAESLLIVADYWFNQQGHLDDAEHYYLKVLDTPAGPAHDLARYKMGWVWINRSEHGKAVKYFEAAAKSPIAEGADVSKALQVKGLALSDLVYSYTESRPAKGALEYFESLCDSPSSLEMVLEKLGNRYFIKQEYDNAVPAYRKLLVMSRDFERDPDRAARLYETLKAAKGKILPRAEDVRAIVRVGARARVDSHLSEKERKELLDDVEIWARDLSTNLQMEAQKREGRAGEDREIKRLYSEAADSYEAYLSLFRNAKYQLAMMRNRADSLFNAGRFAEAGRQFEEVAKKLDGPEREAVLYSSLVGFQSALKNPDRLSYFDRTDSRFGIRQLGAFYVKTYPKSERAAKVKFNMARAAYDEGDYQNAGELFLAFATDYPSDPDAIPAAHLSLDCFHNLKNYKALGDTGTKLLAAALPASVKEEIKGILASAKTEELSEAVIATDTGDSDAIQRLIKIADDPARANTDVAEKALMTAFTTAVAKRELKSVNEIAQKIIARYPKSPSAAGAVLTLARFSLEIGDFDQTADRFESMFQAFNGDPKALEALENAATLRQMLGDVARAIADLEKAYASSKRPELMAKVAELKLGAKDFPGAQAAAQAALAANPGLARAAAVLGESLLEQGKSEQAEQALIAAGRGVQSSAAASADPGQMAGLARLYFLWGEAIYKKFETLGPEQLEAKANLLSQLQQAYTSAAQLGGDWAVAGMYRLGRAIGALSETLEQVPEPAGLKEKEKAQFKAALAKQANELKTNSADMFDACVKRARELEVLTPFALGCVTRKEIDPKIPVSPSGAPPAPEVLAPLREALAKDGGDLVALEKLGRAYLESGDLRRARLVFQRLVEVDDNRGAGHSGLGFALLRLGEPIAAAQELKRAVELDGRDEKARANLAAVRCRWGDSDGAKDELKKLKGTPAGADVDSGYQACR